MPHAHVHYVVRIHVLQQSVWKPWLHSAFVHFHRLFVEIGSNLTQIMLRIIVKPGKRACNLLVSIHMKIHKPDKFFLQMMICLKEMGSTHIHNNHNAKSFIHHNTASVVTSQHSCNMQGQNNCHQNAHICSDALWSSAAYWHFRILASWRHNRPYVMAIVSFFINLGRLFWNVKAQDYIDCGVVYFITTFCVCDAIPSFAIMCEGSLILRRSYCTVVFQLYGLE